MNTSVKSSAEEKALLPDVDLQKNIFNSMTIALSPKEVFEFFKDFYNLEHVFSNFPDVVENFLDLKLESASKGGKDTYTIKWINKPESKIQGHVSFFIEKAPAKRGSYVTAIAEFDPYTSKDKEPSDLIHIFMKRMKQLVETGQVSTTKGQPSGREELKQLH